jgi:general secretion pathway protein H
VIVECRRKRQAHARGFTYIELLVVILILAVAAGAISLSVDPSEDRLMAMEADRLAALFRLAHSQARVNGRPLVWQGDSQGYRFLAGDSVHGNKPDDPLRPRAWPFPVEHFEAPDLVFGLEPLLVPAEIRILSGQRELVLSLDAYGSLRRVR